MQEPGNPLDGPGAPLPNPTGQMPSATFATSAGTTNNSGTPGAALPDELKGFNVGAGLLTWIWSIGMQFWLGLLYIPISAVISKVVPALGLFVWLGAIAFFGIKGNEWAWQSRKWSSYDEFRSTQKTWAIVGVILVAVFFVLMLILAVVAGAVIAAMFTGSHALQNGTINTSFVPMPQPGQ